MEVSSVKFVVWLFFDGTSKQSARESFIPWESFFHQFTIVFSKVFPLCSSTFDMTQWYCGWCKVLTDYQFLPYYVMPALLGKPSSQFILASLTVVLCIVLQQCPIFIDIYTNGAVIESTKWTQPRCDFCSGKTKPSNEIRFSMRIDWVKREGFVFVNFWDCPGTWSSTLRVHFPFSISCELDNHMTICVW